MHKKSDRKGLALGAIFALVLSLFGSVPAAQAATDGSDIGIYPGAGTTFAGTVVSDFPMYAQLKQTSTTTQWTGSNVVVKVEKTSGTKMDVMFTTSNAAVNALNVTSASAYTVIQAGSTSATASALGLLDDSVTHLNVKVHSTSAVASWSAVTLKITYWIDNQGGAKNDAVDTDELFTTQIVTLVHPNSIGGAVTLTNPTAADTTVTVSAVVSGVNIRNLRGGFFLAMSSSHNAYSAGAASTDASVSISTVVTAARAGVVSASIAVAQLSASDSISAAVRYSPSWTGAGANIYAGYLAGSVVKKGIARPAVTTLYSKVVSAGNATASSGTVPVRPNQTYTIYAGAATNSTSVSGVVLSVALTGPTLTMPGSYIKINGGAATTSYPAAISVTTDATGYGSFTLETAGLAAGGTNFVAVVSYLNVNTSTLTLVRTTPAYVIDNAFDIYSATPGSSVALEFDVEDQWQVKSKRTDQRIKLTRSGTGFDYGSSTVSYHAVTAGAASGTFVLPAATTGSAKLDTLLQRYNQDTGQWEDQAGSAGTQITVNVTSVASAFSTASALATTSASISYNVAGGTYSWSGNITVTGTVAGADMVVSAPGLVIHDNGSSKTASATMTIRANASKQITVKFAGEKAGTHTVSFTTAGNTTTSQVIISPAASTTGAVITYDTTNIAKGSTKKITGTLTDVLGNPVETDGHTASILVVYNGSGIALGTMPTNTDEDGKFSFNVIVGANDSGTATVTTTYLKNGASTATADKLTTVGQITIGAETVAAADQKITVGTFKGYVAIYTKGYMGQKLSAKVAGRWLVVDPIAAFKSNDYSRTVRLTGAGYTIAVDLYIDGVFVRSEVVTTK